MFIDEGPNETLAEIASDKNLKNATYALLKKMRAEGRLDEVFEAFCEEYPNHEGIATLQTSQMVETPDSEISERSALSTSVFE